MWAYESVFYQIYPLGLCGAPRENPPGGAPAPENRLPRIAAFLPHMRALGINALYLGPVFYADRHGYDTRDYRRIDPRLGTNGDFAALCAALHESGIRVVLDGVFHHVGRGFWAFQDLLKNRECSRYQDWFAGVNFGGNNRYGDGLWYEGWEGHDELVKLNLANEEVVGHLLGSVEDWIREFGIDGLRLDVAYSLPESFLARLRRFCDERKPDFFLLGEMVHGDYSRLMKEGLLHSVTDYQAHKGLWSSLNDRNLFEINHTLEEHFCRQYPGSHPLQFLDNHDVDRIASRLRDPALLPLAYALLFAIPGIPCLYYGSEWGAAGAKRDGDDALRPAFEQPEETELTAFIARLAAVRRRERALQFGGYRKLLLTNRQMIFERAFEGERILAAFNLDSEPYTAHFDAGAGRARDLLTGEARDFGGGSLLPPRSAAYWKTE